MRPEPRTASARVTRRSGSISRRKEPLHTPALQMDRSISEIAAEAEDHHNSSADREFRTLGDFRDGRRDLSNGDPELVLGPDDAPQ